MRECHDFIMCGNKIIDRKNRKKKNKVLFTVAELLLFERKQIVWKNISVATNRQLA